MPERKMSPEMLEHAISLRQKNWTLQSIADEIGLSIGSLS
jgi:hypothetical protein